MFSVWKIVPHFIFLACLVMRLSSFPKNPSKSQVATRISEYKPNSKGKMEILRMVNGTPDMLLWDFIQRPVVITYRRFDTASMVKKLKKPNNSWFLKLGLIGCPETSVRNYLSTPREISEKCRPHSHRGGSMKLRKENEIWRASSTHGKGKKCKFWLGNLKIVTNLKV
jgi:hypothetical protein